VSLNLLLGALLLIVAVVVGVFVVRRVRLLRAGGVNVALRTDLSREGRGWHLGVGRYQGDEFSWFRPLSVRSGPDRIINREGLEIAARREPTHSEAFSMPPDSMVLRCRAGGARDVEIAMAPDTLTGFLSWLESAPPGRRLPYAS